MKRLIYITFFVLAAAVLARCARADETPAPDAEYATVTLNAWEVARSGEPALPAGVDPDAYHWRYTYEIRTVKVVNDLEYPDQVFYSAKSVSPSLSLTLVRGMKYIVYVWVDVVADGTGADKKTAVKDLAYRPSGYVDNGPVDLNNIFLMTWPIWTVDYSQPGLRTAYAGMQAIDLVGNPGLSSVTVTAKPPTARVRLIATDMDQLLAHGAILAAAPSVIDHKITYQADMYYDKMQFCYSVSTATGWNEKATDFNSMYYGTPLTLPVDVSLTGDDKGLVIQDDVLAYFTGDTRTVTMNLYACYSVKMDDGEVIPMRVLRASCTIPGVPVAPCYRTNVRGRLLTADGHFDISVDALYDDTNTKTQ